jgi:hypothetical protein
MKHVLDSDVSDTEFDFSRSRTVKQEMLSYCFCLVVKSVSKYLIPKLKFASITKQP